MAMRKNHLHEFHYFVLYLFLKNSNQALDINPSNNFLNLVESLQYRGAFFYIYF